MFSAPGSGEIRPDPSHALTAMVRSAEEAHCALRLFLGYENTEEGIDRLLEYIGE